MFLLMNKIDSETRNFVITVSLANFVLVGTTGYIIHYFYRNHKNQVLIKRKQLELSSKKSTLLAKLKHLKTPFENMDIITNLNLQELINAISTGTYKPIDVLQAYQAKALVMDKEFNFITDLNPNVYSDLSAVEKMDKDQLKCIPISIKECLQVNGCDCTCGMLYMSLTPANRDEVMIRTVRLKGMVPFVCTNVPQSGYAIETSNLIFGKTLNPINKKQTCGGSSGGEAAVLASGASILGLGSDIGGSIRIPSSHCGIFGLKPTSLRFSHRHSKHFYSCQNLITVSIGPMARRIDDLVTFFKILTCGDLHHLDPYCCPLSFNDKLYEEKRPLKIGYYASLGESQVIPVPAVVRAVGLAKKALEENGYILIPFSIPDIDYAFYDLYFQCLFSDGGTGFLNYFIADNPIDPILSYITRLIRMPTFLKQIISLIIRPFNPSLSRSLNSIIGKSSVYELWQLNNQVLKYRELVLTAWQAANLDGLICPVLPISAPPLGSSGNILDIIAYTAIYNLLDYSAGTVPVTTVNQSDIDQLVHSYPRDTLVHRRILEYQKESLGMPIGVQCVSMPWREETCLRLMKDIALKISR